MIKKINGTIVQAIPYRDVCSSKEYDKLVREVNLYFAEFSTGACRYHAWESALFDVRAKREECSFQTDALKSLYLPIFISMASTLATLIFSSFFDVGTFIANALCVMSCGVLAVLCIVGAIKMMLNRNRKTARFYSLLENILVKSKSGRFL